MTRESDTFFLDSVNGVLSIIERECLAWPIRRKKFLITLHPYHRHHLHRIVKVPKVTVSFAIAPSRSFSSHFSIRNSHQLLPNAPSARVHTSLPVSYKLYSKLV